MKTFFSNSKTNTPIGLVFSLVGVVSILIFSNGLTGSNAASLMPVLNPQESTESSTQPNEPADSEKDQEQDSESLEVLKKRFDDSIEELREIIKTLARHEVTYLHVDSESSFDEKDKWEAAAEESKVVFNRFKENALALFLAIEKPAPGNAQEQADFKETAFVARILNQGLFRDGEISRCYEVSKKLAELFPDELDIQTDMARISMLANDFDYAQNFAKANQGLIKDFSPKEQVLFQYIDELQTDFNRELKLREKDKTSNLPLVEMKIAGIDEKIVIELFEDEAPETVANFISLIDAGFYEGIIFHRVISAYITHGGLMSMSKFEPTGYTIYDESKRPDRRHHFRGSLATWSNSLEPNSCSAEFAIMNVPAPYLTETYHTVFGRVVSGMEIIDRFQPTRTLNEEERKEEVIEDIIPETIESIKVIRRRDHDYEPNRVQE